MVNQYGNIYEGIYSPDWKVNGWCISYIGYFNIIQIGWYKDNLRNGNWMSLWGNNLSVIESGWYDNDVRVCEMKFDIQRKTFFTMKKIFIDPYRIKEIVHSEIPEKVMVYGDNFKFKSAKYQVYYQISR